MNIINTTPHPLTFLKSDGETLTVPPCGELVNAKPEEVEAGVHPSGAALVQTVFRPSEEGEAILSRLERENPGAVIIGSVIAAQAYPGRVLAMVPAPGFERVPPAEKRMSLTKFTTF